MTHDNIPDLTPFREHIDALDDQIVALIAQRLGVCADVGRYKAKHNVAVMQPDRATAVKDRNAKRGEGAGLRPEFVHALYSLIIDEACALETEIIDG